MRRTVCKPVCGTNLIKDQHFVISKTFVTGDDDLFAFFQALDDFVVLRILPSDADIAAIGFLPVLVDDEDPISARYLKEGSFGDEYALCGLAPL